LAVAKAGKRAAKTAVLTVCSSAAVKEMMWVAKKAARRAAYSVGRWAVETVFLMAGGKVPLMVER
jgi:hypothetical protein